MQGLFSRSSEARFLDRDGVTRSLQTLAAELKDNPTVEAVFLFGSLAGGKPTPRSDADILIVLTEDERIPRDRIPDFLGFFLDAPVPVDVFPFTRPEIDANPFLGRALREGIKLA